MKHCRKYLFRNLRDCQSGVAFVEFALCIPILLIVFFGAIEVSRYFLAAQKTEKTLDLVSDVVARSDQNQPTEQLTAANLATLMASVSQMMSPYEFGDRGVVIITDVSQPSDTTLPPVINWQYCGGGTLNKASAIGTASVTPTKNNATLPAGFTMNAGEEVIIGEIYYNFSPITVQDIIGDIQLYRRVFFIPRLGVLKNFSSHC